jgi:hypothetical protein
MSKLKKIHMFLIDLDIILTTKLNSDRESGVTKSSLSHTEGQRYEVGYILDFVEKIIYEDKDYVNQ